MNDERLIQGWEMVWTEWKNAIRNRKHGFHTFTLATIADGIPDARTIVLRGVDPEARLLQFNVDMRSPKAAQMQANPEVACVFYDVEKRLQVRAWGKVALHNQNEIVHDAWEKMQGMSRECYRTPYAPGSLVTGEVLEPLVLEEACRNMGICYVALTTLELMHLLHTGHRRAYYTWNDTETPMATWLHP